MLISTRESAPSCHDEEACSRVRHEYYSMFLKACSRVRHEYYSMFLRLFFAIFTTWIKYQYVTHLKSQHKQIEYFESIY